MEVNLNIDPAELAKKITEALTNEAFSDLFKKAVEDTLTELSKKEYSNDSIIKRTVKEFFTKKMVEVLEQEYSERAKEICRATITDGKLQELANVFASRIRLSDY